jgi:hypothetical protein
LETLLVDVVEALSDPERSDGASDVHWMSCHRESERFL